MLTNFPSGISSMGMPVVGAGIPATFGRYIFVDATNGNDGNDGSSMDKAVKTVAIAYSLATTNANDVIVLSGYADHTLSAMLTVSKNRVHFVGLGPNRRYGQAAKIVLPVTTVTTDLFAVKNIGVRNSFTNIKFINNNTVAQNIGTVGEGGEYAVYTNCEFYNSTSLNSATDCELVLNGDSAQFYNCTFGSLADAVVGDVVRPSVLMTSGLVTSSQSGGPSRDVLFDGCRFWKKAGGTTTSFIKIAATADLERGMEIHDCQFIASVLGSTPATAITSATLTNGYVALTGDTCAMNCTKIATATGIFSGLPARVATATVGIQVS